MEDGTGSPDTDGLLVGFMVSLQLQSSVETVVEVVMELGVDAELTDPPGLTLAELEVAEVAAAALIDCWCAGRDDQACDPW